MASGAPVSPPAAPFRPEGLLLDVLAVSLTAIHLVRPLYGPTGTDVVDFALEYLNPAGQRMTGLPERPGGTALTRFPHTVATGIFEYYRRVFETGETQAYAVNYQANDLDNYFQFAARRSGDWLVVSFTDTSDQDRSAVEVALRESQAREQQARAEAEAQRQHLHNILLQLPAQVATNRGPDHVYDLVNPRYQQQFPARVLQGLPVRQALPELEGQQFFELLDQVYQTGEPFYGHEMPAAADYANTGQPEVRYFDVFFQALRDAQGRIDGVLNFAYDVTAQVAARRQVEHLNQELEARVQARTQELAEQQHLLNQILAQVPAAITTLRGPDHRFTFANARYQQLTEGRVQVGRTVAETLPEVAEQGFIELLDNVYGNSQTFEGKEIALLLALPGEPPVQHYLDFTYQPMADGNGQTQGILVFAVDVTEQVRTRRQATALQAQLLATAQHQAAERLAFYQVFEQTPALVALLRAPAHRFEYVNPAYQALFAGRPLVGLDAVVAAPELGGQGFIALLDRVYQTGETYFGQELPFTPVPAPGLAPRTTYFDFTYQAYRENGEVAGISLIAFDVTEQVLARQERARQQRQLREVFEQAPVAIFVVRGAEYVFDVVNPSMGVMLGSAPDQVLGQRYFDLLPALAEQGYRDLLDQVWHTGQAYVAQEQAAQLPHHRAGETGYYSFTYVPVREAEGSITGIMCVAVDVTSQVQARQQVDSLNEKLAAINEELTATNEELNKSNTQLTRTNVDLDTFVYTASHDLKAPITNIESITLALRETLPAEVQQDEMIAHLLDLLAQTTTRFQLTIGQLTDLSKLQLAHTGPAEPVNLAAVVESVRLDLAPVIADANAQLTVAVAPELMASFSPANLRSAVYNLLSNAVKYRAFDRPAQVWVRAFPAGPRVVLEVQDNGLGLSEVQQRQLFGLFQRLHTHVEGTGVGLYITKRLVENGGGTIAVQSQVDAGTTFTLTFPA
ncbi:PAS domain-containing sensor histidine kinase [Hymenobacter bucti]|uniref:histidine kinase n=1 Tax=Hymenobacter bucti TaxID=1844114 RepID=A0ABW4QY35_9BACT